MKRAILSLTMLMALAAGGFAQEADKKVELKNKKQVIERAEKQTEKIATTLELDEASKAQVLEINKKYALKQARLEQKYKAQKKAIKAEKQAEMQTVLSKEQLLALETARKERKQNKTDKK